MRNINFVRPILLIAVAFLTKTIVYKIAILVGAEENIADNLGFIAMIAAALYVFRRFRTGKRG